MTGACGSLAARAHTQHVPGLPLPAHPSHSNHCPEHRSLVTDMTLLSRDQCSLRGTEGREGSRRTSISLLSVSARLLPGASPTRSRLLSRPPGSARDTQGTINLCSVRPSGLELEARGHAASNWQETAPGLAGKLMAKRPGKSPHTRARTSLRRAARARTVTPTGEPEGLEAGPALWERTRGLGATHQLAPGRSKPGH